MCVIFFSLPLSLSIYQPNPEGETALMLASALPHLHQSMWPLLLRAGADPHGPVDCQGTNAMTWALREQVSILCHACT